MPKTQGENEEMVEQAKEAEIQASGDAIVIADGLHNIAEQIAGLAAAVRDYTRAIKQDISEEEPQEMDTYLDGTKK